jgi:hypothetical protein
MEVSEERKPTLNRFRSLGPHRGFSYFGASARRVLPPENTLASREQETEKVAHVWTMSRLLSDAKGHGVATGDGNKCQIVNHPPPSDMLIWGLGPRAVAGPKVKRGGGRVEFGPIAADE